MFRPFHRGATQAPICNISTDSNFADPSYHEKTHGVQTSSKSLLAVQSLSESESNLPPLGEAESKKHSESTTWRPLWLKRLPLSLFCCFFLFSAAAFAAMLGLSDQELGLGTVREDLAQLWRFGPTAILTVVVILWGRVELQAMRYMPWVGIQPGTAGKRTPAEERMNSLDYTSMLTPEVLFRTLKNKHFFVFLVALNSIILKVMVVLSPGLFHLGHIPSTQETMLRVSDMFRNEQISDGTNDVTTSGSSNTTAIIPFIHASAVRDVNMSLPFGVTKSGAHQIFRRADNGLRGSVDAPVTTVVDGVFTETNCLLLSNYTFHTEKLSAQRANSPYFDMSFEGCDTTNRVLISDRGILNGTARRRTGWTVQAVQETPCPKLTQQHPQYLYTAHSWLPSSQRKFEDGPEALGAVLCTSNAWISSVEVTDDGVNPQLKQISDQNKTFINADFWSLRARASWDGIPLAGPISPAALLTEKGYLNQSDLSNFRSDVLHDAVQNLTKILDPFISHYLLRDTSRSETVLGSTPKKVPRLFINQVVCIVMAVMLGVLTLSTIWMIFKSKTIFGTWKRDPATILGAMIYKIGSGRNATEPLFDAKSQRKSEWENSTYSPLALRTWLRVIVSTYILALIISLGIILRVSETSEGIVTIYHGVSSIWWTSVPSLALFLISLYATSSDTAVRDLGTLHNLSTRPCSVRELDMSFLDMLGLRALFHSVRQKNVAISTNQIVAISCGFLATLSTLLYTPIQVLDVSKVEYSTMGQLRSPSPVEESQRIREENLQTLALLILPQKDSNFSWPEFTYGDMVFPRFDARVSGTRAHENSNASLELDLKAAQITEACYRLPIPKQSPKFEVKQSRLGVQYTGHLTRDVTCKNGNVITYDYPVVMNGGNDTRSGIQYVAGNLDIDNPAHFDRLCGIDVDSANTSTQNDNLYPSARTQAFFWGTFSTSELQYELVSTWSCNYSWSEIPTKAYYKQSDGKFQIDVNKPPVLDTSGVRPWPPSLGLPALNIFNTTRELVPMISSSFHKILEPIGSMKLEDFGNQAKEDDILRAMNNLYKLTWAQLANLELRYNITDASEATKVIGTTTRPGVNRLYQDRATTIALMAIMSFALLINLWALISVALKYFLRRTSRFFLDLELKGLSVSGFNTISGIDCLLSGSNIFKTIPSDAHHLSPEEFYTLFNSLRFYKGWFERLADRKRDFTIGTMDDRNFQFLGSK